jgi:hypothetical protein
MVGMLSPLLPLLLLLVSCRFDVSQTTYSCNASLILLHGAAVNVAGSVMCTGAALVWQPSSSAPSASPLNVPYLSMVKILAKKGEPRLKLVTSGAGEGAAEGNLEFVCGSLDVREKLKAVITEGVRAARAAAANPAASGAGGAGAGAGGGGAVAATGAGQSGKGAAAGAISTGATSAMPTVTPLAASLLEKDPLLLAQFQELVATGLVAQQDFWATRVQSLAPTEAPQPGRSSSMPNLFVRSSDNNSYKFKLNDDVFAYIMNKVGGRAGAGLATVLCSCRA